MIVKERTFWYSAEAPPELHNNATDFPVFPSKKICFGEASQTK